MSHNRALQPAADAVAIRAHGERAAPRGPGASNGSRAPPRLSAPAASDRYRCPPPSLRGKVQSRARASCQSPDGVLICAGACECGRGSGVARRGASTRAAETSDASSLTPRARARTAASSSIHGALCTRARRRGQAGLVRERASGERFPAQSHRLVRGPPAFCCCHRRRAGRRVEESKSGEASCGGRSVRRVPSSSRRSVEGGARACAPFSPLRTR